MLAACAASPRVGPARAVSAPSDDCAAARDPAACLEGLARARLPLGNAGRAESRAIFGRYCERGVARGCAFQGSMMLAGRGGPRDERGGAALAERACTARDSYGCAIWGGALASGRGVDAADPARAATLLQQHCEAGSPMACDYLGALLGLGLGVPRDEARARRLFEQACEHEVSACFNLAAMLVSGTPDEASRARAARYVERACAEGLENACASWADIQRTGAGVPADAAAAVRTATAA